MAKKRGFTLIEVMVVMVIIAILATAGISSYGWYRARTSDLKAKIEIANLVAATLEFRSDHNGRNPTRLELDEYMASVMKTKKVASLLPRALADSPLVHVKHPAGSKSICIRVNTSSGAILDYDAPCEIVYYRFSDGKFAFSASVRTKSMLKEKFHAAVVNDGRTTYGIFDGNSPIIGRAEVHLDNATSGYNGANGGNTPISLITSESLTWGTSITPSSTTETNTNSSSSSEEDTSSTTETNTEPSSSTETATEETSSTYY